VSAEASGALLRHLAISNQAPHKGEAVVQAPVLRMRVWLKNEQLNESHAGYGAAPAMNGLSTDCSTVFVRKRKARA
jgi:hypothetical protein